MMSATEPWSGHYSLQPPLYAMMHTTQFTKPGVCRYLDTGWGIAANLGPAAAPGNVQFGGFLDATNQVSGPRTTRGLP